MPVINHTETLRTANCLDLRILHFARGTYPEATGAPQALPLNRFFMPISNPDGEECTISDANLSYTLRPGCAYFIPIYHAAKVKLSSNLRFLSIQFTLEWYEGVDLFSHCRAVREIRDSRYLERAEEAFEQENPYAAASLLRTVTQDFASCLLASMESSELDFVTRFAEFLPELDYIRQHCRATTTVEELAAVRGTARETFSRKFSAAIGVSPKQFLTRALLNRACSLLLRGNRLAREVAFELGFSNEFYFSRFFRTHTGLPPHKFRKFYLGETGRNDIPLPRQESGTASEQSV